MHPSYRNSNKVQTSAGLSSSKSSLRRRYRLELQQRKSFIGAILSPGLCFLALMLAAASLVAPLSAASPPAWVGSATHTWSPRLGGGIWHQEGKVVRGIAPALAEYPRPVLVGLRSPMTDMGYRFDLNSWDPNAPNDFGTDRYSHEDVLKVLGASGCGRIIVRHGHGPNKFGHTVWRGVEWGWL